MVRFPLRSLLLALPLVACGGDGGGDSASHAPEVPARELTGPTRIVVITLDTLRWDSFSGREGKKTSMPRTKKWAQDATVFRRYYSATSTTQPTHATLFTGLHPWKTGVSFNGAIFADEHETVAELLQQEGFSTAAIVASFPVHHRFGWDQGFDHYNDEFTKGEAGAWSGHDLEDSLFFSDADVITDLAVAQVDAAEGDRQFFWFHYYDPHAPYGASGTTEAREDLSPRSIIVSIESGRKADKVCDAAREAYDYDVRFMDKALRILFDRLEQDAEEFETHVVIVSDHGESFGEGGSLGHGKRLTPEQIHVPLIIQSPLIEAGERDETVGTIDVTATLLSMAGIRPLPAGARDLTQGEIEERPVMGMRRTYNSVYKEKRTDLSEHLIKAGDRWFFIHESDKIFTGNSGSVTTSDDGEEISGAELDHYREVFSIFEKEFKQDFDTEQDPEALEALRALGYAD